MAAIKVYLDSIRARELAIARKLGADLAGLDAQTRVLNLSLLSVIAVLAKTLIENGIITVAQLNAVLDSARDDTWWSEPDAPADPAGS